MACLLHVDRRLQAALLACCLLLLSSCAFPGSVKPTVKIGLSAPFEGLYRNLGYEVLYAVRLAVRERNAAGGVGGRYLVELVALNDFEEAVEATRQAQELAADPGVLGTIGGWSAVTARAAAPTYDRLGLAFLTAYDEDARLSLATEAARLATFDLRARSVAALHAPDAAYQALARQFTSALVSNEIPVLARSAATAGDWVEALGVEGQAQPGLLFLCGDASTVAGWLVAARSAGFSGPIVGSPDLGSRLVVDLAGNASEGVLFVSPLPPPPDDTAFIQDYESLSGGAPPGPAAAWAYGAAQRLLDALGQAARQERHPTRAGVAAALAGGQGAVHVYTIRDGQPYAPYP